MMQEEKWLIRRSGGAHIAKYGAVNYKCISKLRGKS